jgi:spermidine/putrescine transport system substrate-binding protein
MRLALILLALLSFAPAAWAEELQLYNWQDYIAPAVLERFQAETGIAVVVTTYASNEEMYAGVKQQPGKFDLIVPDQYMVARMAEEGLLDVLNGPALPQFYNIEPAWIGTPHDPINAYSVPYLCGTTAFAVDRSVLADPAASLATLFTPAPAAKGKVALLAELDEVFALAAIYLGVPICTESDADLGRIEAVLRRLRPDVAGFPKENLPQSIADPSFVIHMAWNGDVLRARASRPAMSYVFPREGVIAWLSAVSIPKGAPHKAAALQFIDFLLRPEIAALQTGYTGFANAVQGSDDFLAPEMQRAPEFAVPPSVRMVFLPRCSDRALDKRQRVLEAIKPE